MTSSLRTWPATGAGPTDTYARALAQFDQAARRLGLDDTTTRLLRAPARESHFAIPVRDGGGRVRVVPAVLVQHTDARGPALADVRLGADPDDARAQAMSITWTAALADLPGSGAGGQIVVSRTSLTSGEREQLCRGWVRQSAGAFRAELEATDGDAADWQHTAWMRDEYRNLCGAAGRRSGDGSLTTALRHVEAAARSIVGALQIARTGVPGDREVGLAVSIQGEAALAGLVAARVAELGGRVRAMSWPAGSTAPCTVARELGVTPTELAGMCDTSGVLDRRSAARLGYAVHDGNAWLTQPVDAVVLTGPGVALRAADVDRLHPRVRFVVEGAFGLLDPETDERLAARGVTVVPDLLAAVGRLVALDAPGHVRTVGTPRREQLDAATDAAMSRAGVEVLAATRGGLRTLREAAYGIALRRVIDACHQDGWL